ncbi:MAG TPA: hypothetical protein VMS75_12005 [Terriglobales bacterium]|nr:hypothetical protein [Terriglobales bacterium]
MTYKRINRKEFLSTLGKAGVGTCMCAAAAGMSAALGGQTAPQKPAQPPAPPKPPEAAKPGEKTAARAAKRMEFGDGWLRRFFEAVDATLDEPTKRRLLMANGKACFAAFAGPPKKQPATDALKKFTAWVKDKGKDRGYSIDGNVISFEFVGSAETGQAAPEAVCLCPMAEAQKPGAFSRTYCFCSVGYVKEMHERTLGRTVEVELVDSVLWGGRRCKFRMTAAPA